MVYIFKVIENGSGLIENIKTVHIIILLSLLLLLFVILLFVYL
jgi:hypothetical protein